MITKQNARYRNKDEPLKNDESKVQNAEVRRAIIPKLIPLNKLNTFIYHSPLDH